MNTEETRMKVLREMDKYFQITEHDTDAIMRNLSVYRDKVTDKDIENEVEFFYNS